MLVAPDSFKGTYSALEISVAISEGLAAAGIETDLCPAGDGGEGTMDALVGALGGDFYLALVADGLGSGVRARFALLPGGDVAIVESAEASGLARVRPSPSVAWSASTYGTGELIAAALAEGARRVLVTLGGTATTDGGLGAIAALEAQGGIGQASIDLVCDVSTPFEDAAAVFGPQKGADRRTIAKLRARLSRVATTLPRDPRGVPMTGCAGGLAGGLWAQYGARLRPGAEFVLDTLGFDARAGRASVVVCGEGCLDSQTRHGKLVAEIARRCASDGQPVHAIVGRCDLDDAGIAALGLASVAEASALKDVRTAGRCLGDGLAQAAPIPIR